jgi:SAM-dependent methyltransferase
MSREQQQQRRVSLCEWFAQTPGRSLRAMECHALRAIWPTLYGKVAVQLGSIGPVDLLESCNAPVRALHDLPGLQESSLPSIYGLPEALPFDTRSVDIALLPHTLEFSHDPHQVLREISRVLSPEGHVVVLGFNPFSLWGLWRLLKRRRGVVPWSGHFLHLYYRPPLASETAMDRLRFLDKAGDRWWPMAGAVYLLVARKRVAGMTPLRPEWRSLPALGKAVARPALRVIRGG